MPVITVYKMGASTQILDSDLPSYQKMGWSTSPSQPAPSAGTGSSGSSGSSSSSSSGSSSSDSGVYVPPPPKVYNNSPASINALYQQYFGRPAFDTEITFWKTQPLTDLNTQLSNLYRDTAHTEYDGSPILKGQTRTQNQIYNSTVSSSILNDPKVLADQGANGTTMSQWLQKNMSLLPKLTANGYTLQDVINEAYSQVHNNKSAFSADMTTTPRAQNNPAGGSQTDNSNKNQSSQDQTGSSDSGSNSNADSGSNSNTNTDTNTGTDQNIDPNSKVVMTGNYTIGKIPNDSSIYLFDNVNKTIQKFDSADAIANYGLTETSYQDLVSSGNLKTIPINDLVNNQGYTLSGESIKADGTDPLIDKKLNSWVNFTTYGQKMDPQVGETNISILKGIYKTAVAGGVISQATADSAMNGNTFVKHLTAITNGGYSIEDVMKDLKRLDLVSKGNSSLASMQVISPDKTKSQYAATPQGAAVASNAALNLPTTVGGLNSEEMKLPIAQISDATFKVLTPILDPTSPEFQDAASKIGTVFLDHQQNMLEAKSQQDLTLAHQQWLQDKAQIEKLYGINLSDDITTAWRQYQTALDNFSNADVSGANSMPREALDQMVSDIKKRTDQARDKKNLDLQNKDLNYAVNQASPAENAKLTDAQLEQYGLKPDAETLAFYTMDNLKKLNPTASDSYLQAIIDAAIDTSTGRPMYYSRMYRTLMQNRLTALVDKQTTQANTLIAQNKQAQDEAARKIGLGSSVFDKAQTGDSSTTNSLITTTSSNTAADSSVTTDTNSNQPAATAYTSEFEKYWANLPASFEKSEAAKKAMFEQFQKMGDPTLKTVTTPSLSPSTSNTSTSPQKTSTPTATNTLKAYDVNNNYAVVYVQPGVYVPGVSATPKAGTSASTTTGTSSTVGTTSPNLSAAANAAGNLGTGTTGTTTQPVKRKIFRKGADIYNATTNQKIGATDWANNWSGKTDVQEIPAPY